MANGNGISPTWLDHLAKLIKDIGFPVAVAIFLLWRTDVTLHVLTEAVHEMRSAIVELRHAIEAQK